ncbi:unnamed protein product [Calypogeia fissa]
MCTMTASTFFLTNSQVAGLPRIQCVSGGRHAFGKGDLSQNLVAQIHRPKGSWHQLALQGHCYKNCSYFRIGLGGQFGWNSSPWKRSRRRNCSVQNGRLKVTSSAATTISAQNLIAEENGGVRAWQQNTAGLMKFLPFSEAFKKVVPFIYSETANILKGWVCCCVAVGCLYLFVPEIGSLSTLLSKGDLKQLGKKTTFAAILVTTRSISQFWQQAFLWEAVLNVTFKVRSYVYSQVLQRDMTFFEGRHAIAAGDVAFRITTESEDMGDTVYSLLHTMVPSALQLIAMGTRMITLNPLLALATFSVVPCMAVVMARLGERLRKLARKGQDSIARLSAYLTEVLPSMFVIKAHGGEAAEQWRFNRLAWTEREAQLGKKRMKAFIPEMITLVYVMTGTVLLAVGTWAISKGTFDAAGMVSFITSLILLVDPMQALGRAFNEMKNGEPAIERLFEFTRTSSKVREKPDAIPLQNVNGEVELLGVSFRYDESSPWVLRNVNLYVRPGETVALVGASGGGKTTLAKLLLRLYDPIYGNIIIDGQDIRSLSLKSLRKQVAIVPQETTLFTGTVAENIAYGQLSAEVDINAVKRAAQLANADEFIQKLSDGYATNLGDRASSLSGGQRQRLAIARALYQEATILILDEATSALDNKSEILVRDALERLMADRTVFVIAHRLETVQRADRILLLDGGKIVEEGTHLSLLGQGGKYAALYTRQEPSMAIPEALAPQ